MMSDWLSARFRPPVVKLRPWLVASTKNDRKFGHADEVRHHWKPGRVLYFCMFHALGRHDWDSADFDIRRAQVQALEVHTPVRDLPDRKVDLHDQVPGGLILGAD
jgi:hypothetical protein